MNVLLLRLGHQARQAHQGDVPTSCIDTQNIFLCRGSRELIPPSPIAAVSARRLTAASRRKRLAARRVGTDSRSPTEPVGRSLSQQTKEGEPAANRAGACPL